jgi:hypothetical protein
MRNLDVIIGSKKRLFLGSWLFIVAVCNFFNYVLFVTEVYILPASLKGKPEKKVIILS